MHASELPADERAAWGGNENQAKPMPNATAPPGDPGDRQAGPTPYQVEESEALALDINFKRM